MDANLTLASALAKARLKETVQRQQQQLRETSDEPSAAPASNLDAVNKQRQPRKNSSGQRSGTSSRTSAPVTQGQRTRPQSYRPLTSSSCPQLRSRRAPEDLLPRTSCEMQLLRLFRTFCSAVSEKRLQASERSPVVPVTTGGAAQADTPKFPETRQLSTTPASAPSAAEPERVETDVVPVGTADTTEGQGETAADSDDEMCVTSATLKRPLDDSVEQDGASSTSSQEPPAKAPQGRRRSLKPKPKGRRQADTPKFPETRQLSTTPASAPSAAEPERVETDVVPVGTADTTEGQGETAADSDDEMCVTSATLKRPLDDSVEQDGASSTSSQEPPAKAPQGRRRSLKPKPK
ncbi:hypothetical protein MRX96_055521, partial [Rhipicephalus microplus]